MLLLGKEDLFYGMEYTGRLLPCTVQNKDALREGSLDSRVSVILVMG